VNDGGGVAGGPEGWVRPSLTLALPNTH